MRLRRARRCWRGRWRRARRLHLARGVLRFRALVSSHRSRPCFVRTPLARARASELEYDDDYVCRKEETTSYHRTIDPMIGAVRPVEAPQYIASLVRECQSYLCLGIALARVVFRDDDGDSSGARPAIDRQMTGG
jgi:hypothetical protein